MTWNVLYTKPRSEKKVLDRLLKKGFHCYCPTQKTLKQWSDRKKWVEEPIFKSYVFVEEPDSEEERLAIIETLGVVRFMFWLGEPAVVREEEITTIKNFLSSHSSVESIAFDVGAELKIKGGVLKGSSGVVVYQTKRDVVLSVKQLGMSMIARLSVSDVGE